MSQSPSPPLPESLLQADLMENLLRHADNPGNCATYITEQVRELIGVQIVALVSVDAAAPPRLVGICPKRREADWEQPAFSACVTWLLTLNTPRMIDPQAEMKASGNDCGAALGSAMRRSAPLCPAPQGQGTSPHTTRGARRCPPQSSGGQSRVLRRGPWRPQATSQWQWAAPPGRRE